MANFCKQCGAELAPGNRFCKMCGAPVDVVPEETVQVQAEQAQVNQTPVNPNPVVVNVQPAVSPAPAPQPIPVQQVVPPINVNINNQRMTEDNIPEEYRPLGMWKYFWIEVLLSIPFVGFILTFVFSFAPKNVNMKYFARSRFCIWIFAAIIFAVVAIIAAVTGVGLMGFIQNLQYQY